MRLSNPVVKLFDCDVSGLQRALAATPLHLWDVDQSRQKTFAVHRHTRSILFTWLDNDWQPGQPIEPKTYSYAPPALASEVEIIARRLADHYGGHSVKVMLAELQPGGKIAKHIDRDDALRFAHRCHVPIFTNEGVEFFIGHRTHPFEVGSAYEFDNTLPHWVFNGGEEARVHLIIDVLDDQGGLPAVADQEKGKAIWVG